MNDELRPLVLDALMSARLPIGFRRILVSDHILDEGTTSRLILTQPRYRHVATFVHPPAKQISKVER